MYVAPAALLHHPTVAETKVSLVHALAARYRALTAKDAAAASAGGTGGTPAASGIALPVEVGDTIVYKAYKGDGPDKARAIHFQQVPSAAVFEARVPEPWEAKLLQLPGGVGGGRTTDGAGEDAASSAVKRAYAKAEQFRAFHTLQGDRVSLVVSVPVPPRIGLAELLSEGERAKLAAMGVRMRK